MTGKADIYNEVDTTSLNTNDSSPPQHGIRGSEGHISGHLNKAIEGRQRAIAAGNQLKQDWLDAEHWRALAKAHNYRLPHWYLPLTATSIGSSGDTKKASIKTPNK